MAEPSRLDILEGRVEELSTHWHRLFGELGRLDQKVDALAVILGARIDRADRRFDGIDRQFEGIDRRFDAVDRRFDAVDRRFEGIDCRFDALEQKIDRRFEAVDREFVDLRAELSKQFRWTFSTLLALLGMLLTVGAGVATALLRN